MFNGESKKRPTVSLRGKSKEEDRTEFIRRARTQREGRARERLHLTCAITIQRIWRARSCVGKWRQREREMWDKKMHDVGRVQAMLAAAGRVFQVPSRVLQTLLSELLCFHTFPLDAGRFRAVLGLILAASIVDAASANAEGGAGIFGPLNAAATASSSKASGQGGVSDSNSTRSSDTSPGLVVDDQWTLLITRLGTLCLHYTAEMVAFTGKEVGGSHSGTEATKGDAMTIVDADEGHDNMEAEVRGAAESAVQVLGLLSSPEQWRRQCPPGAGTSDEAHLLCRRLLASLALGKLRLRPPMAGGDVSGSGVGIASATAQARRPLVLQGKAKSARDGVRLVVRASKDEVTGDRMRTPRLFGVLRVLWDAAATAGGAGSGSGGRVSEAARLLCAASLEALGMGGSMPNDGMRQPAKIALMSGGTRQQDGGLSAQSERRDKQGDLVGEERREVLTTFASAVLPAPRLLEHPLRAFLVDPMLAGDAAAWWELVSVAGADVATGEGGAGSISGVGRGMAARRDVAWTFANILKVDTGAGASAAGAGAGAEHARCLVRALCRLLGKVSLRVLLQGAQQIAPTTGASDTVEGAGVRMEAAEVEDDQDGDDMDMDDLFNNKTGSSRGGTAGVGGNGEDGDYTGGGIRLEAIVRHHRGRCALKTGELASHETQQAAPGRRSQSRGGSKGVIKTGMGGSGPQGGMETEAGRAAEVEAMAAAANRLADPAIVGKLFDILPPTARYPSNPSSQQPGAPKEQGPTSEPRADSQEDDPVLSLCSLYADVVMHGVRPGPAASAANVSATGAARSTTPAKAVLNALAFGRPKAPIAARLWAYLRGRQDLALFAEGKGGRGEKAGVQSALFLFSSTFSHQLLALDDEEFYEKQRPFTLEEVRQLAGFLKNWLCRLYWLDPAITRLMEEGLPSDPSMALRQCEARLREALLMLSTTRLFNQLYERNTRRSFMDAEAWYWRAISAKELSAPDRVGGSRQNFFSRGNLGMVLTNIPQVIPFFQRVSIFREMIDTEREEHQSTAAFTRGSARIRIRRETLYEDSAEELTKLGSALKGRIQITFMNQHGVEEAGIDGGGVFKEYMDLLTKRAFDPQYALFLATEDQYLFPNPAASMVEEDYLFHFQFLGRVLAKAVFEDILVEPQFSPVFLNKLLGRHNYIDDLYSLDPELYRNIMQLKAIVQKGGDVADLCLTFCVTTTAFGDSKTWDLIPGGRDVAVTNSSVISYIHLMANFKLNVQTARPCKAFLQGFRDLIPVEWICLFNPHELQRLIGGEGGRAIDVDDLKQNTRCAGGYHESQPVMQWFWEAIESFSPEEQGQFLKFVTSCSRPPLLGFERLNPPICVQRVPNGEDGRLPSSATCMNLLKLPQYADKQTLREKLLYAISANAGFELT